MALRGYECAFRCVSTNVFLLLCFSFANERCCNRSHGPATRHPTAERSTCDRLRPYGEGKRQPTISYMSCNSALVSQLLRTVSLHLLGLCRATMLLTSCIATILVTPGLSLRTSSRTETNARLLYYPTALPAKQHPRFCMIFMRDCFSSSIPACLLFASCKKHSKHRGCCRPPERNADDEQSV